MDAIHLGVTTDVIVPVAITVKTHIRGVIMMVVVVAPRRTRSFSSVARSPWHYAVRGEFVSVSSVCRF